MRVRMDECPFWVDELPHYRIRQVIRRADFDLHYIIKQSFFLSLLSSSLFVSQSVFRSLYRSTQLLHFSILASGLGEIEVGNRASTMPGGEWSSTLLKSFTCYRGHLGPETPRLSPTLPLLGKLEG
jgi:hypothetical protein